MGDLRQDLALSARETRETHISWVFLDEQRAWKVKKPVNFGFLDFTDLESRRRACEAEVALNARLAPHVYRGLVPVTRDASGRHRLGGDGEDGEVVDWAVEMVRLADADRLDLRLASGRHAPDVLQRLAQLIAQFHAGARHDAEVAAFGRVELIRRNVLENFSRAHAALAELVSDAEQREVEEYQLGFLSDRRELFERRMAEGRIRDGHGDLRLEHVYVDAGEQVTVIDCIEFNERFRFADVCADVAFLSMDLAFAGRIEDKERFLAAYARESGDHDLYALVDFYESYRAYVRAKVGTLSFADAPVGARRELEQRVRRYFLLALASERPELEERRMIAVGGVIASGKSSLAEALGRELAIASISSDRVRKALSGVSATTPLLSGAFADSYSEQATERVYAEVFRRARVVLDSGRSVVVDASFRSRAQREAARQAARDAGVPFSFVECRASEQVCRARLAERARAPSESDGRMEIFDDFVARYQPVVELPAAEHVVIETSGSLADSLAAARRAGVC